MFVPELKVVPLLKSHSKIRAEPPAWSSKLCLPVPWGGKRCVQAQKGVRWESGKASQSPSRAQGSALSRTIWEGLWESRCRGYGQTGTSHLRQSRMGRAHCPLRHRPVGGVWLKKNRGKEKCEQQQCLNADFKNSQFPHTRLV